MTPEAIQQRARWRRASAKYRATDKGRHANRKTPTYRSWKAMWLRTTYHGVNGYQNYGGRGITVCERWREYAAFLADMGDRPEGMTLDRINVDGNYEPQNCRWATYAEQRRGQRPTNTWRCGHPKTPENTRKNGSSPTCRTCRRESERRYRAS